MGRFERDFAKMGFTMGIRLAALRRHMEWSQADLRRPRAYPAVT